MSQKATDIKKKSERPSRNQQTEQESSGQQKISAFVCQLDIPERRNGQKHQDDVINNDVVMHSGRRLRSNKSTNDMATNDELTLKDIKSWMDTKFAAIIQQNEETKARIDSLVGRLEKNESDVFDLQQKTDQLQQKTDQLQTENKRLKDKLDSTMDRLMNQEAQQRKNNLRFYNLKESREDNARDKVTGFIETILGQDSGCVTDAFRVGRPPNATDDNQRPRPVIARFNSQQEATKIKIAAWKLEKGRTSIGVGEDLPLEWAQARAKAYKPIVRPAKDAGKTVRWRGMRCFVNGTEVNITQHL